MASMEQALHRLLLSGLLFLGGNKQILLVATTLMEFTTVILIVPQAVIEVAETEWQPGVPSGNHRLCRKLQAQVFIHYNAPLYLYWSLVAEARDGLPLVSSHILTRSALRLVQERPGYPGAHCSERKSRNGTE